MEMRNKSLLIIGLVGLACTLLLTYFSFKMTLIYWPIILIAGTLLTLVTFFIIHRSIVKRIEQLNQQISFATTNTDARIKETGNDEVTAIARQANTIIDTIQHNNNTFEQRVEERSKELQKKIIQLQHQVSEFKLTEKKLMNHRDALTQLARYDSLTALPNRIFFNEILNKTINHAKRRNKIIAILYITINSFNDIIMNLGHDVGDHLLKEVGSRFSNVLRSEDVLAKLEGDEFIVLLSDINKPKFAGTVAEKLLKVCSQPMQINAHDFIVTANIGICIFPNDGESLETLLKNAEFALLKAKSTKQSKQENNAAETIGSYQFYTQEMDIEAHEYIQLEAALRKAIENNELALYYQPKLHLKKGVLTGVEALIRWTHPEYGIISPAKFIPIAEETGLIKQIGEWSLREACKTNKYWQEEGYEHMTVAVKLSPNQFNHRDIAEIISGVLAETRLNPKYLELEINESTIMSDVEQAAKKLDHIKKTGVQVSIDHFGIGYTSISHLKQLSISSVKIDKSFIVGIPQKPDDIAITGAIIALAHNLGLEVVAEGVETAEQVQLLSSQNCDLIQGYFISHPLPAQKVVLQFKKLMERVLL